LGAPGICSSLNQPACHGLILKGSRKISDGRETQKEQLQQLLGLLFGEWLYGVEYSPHPQKIKNAVNPATAPKSLCILVSLFIKRDKDYACSSPPRIITTQQHRLKYYLCSKRENLSIRT
jgi:hypothetical protein